MNLRLLILLLALCACGAHAEEIDIIVDGVRPVSQAIDAVAERLGYVVTYEDPRYVYAGDLRDVTAEVNKSGGRGKIFWPMSSTLEVRRLSLPAQPDPTAASEVIRRILDVYAQGTVGGRFKVVSAGNMLHVVPDQVRDQSGAWIEQASILDTRINIAPAPRSVDAMIDAICAALQAAGTPVVLYDDGGSRLMYDGPSIDPVQSARDELAREVLIRTLARRGPNIGWKLSYFNTTAQQGYFLTPVTQATREPPAERLITPRGIPGIPNSGMPPTRN